MGKIGLAENMYNRMEILIMDRLVMQDSPDPFFKWLFKVPILQYNLGMGWMIGRSVLLLTTTSTPLEHECDRKNDRYRIAAGWAGKTDWYRNVKKNPKVHVAMGRRQFDAIAESDSDEEVAMYMMTVSSRSPGMDKVWNRWFDKPVDGTLESYIRAAKFSRSSG